jgi:hypothetical protein
LWKYLPGLLEEKTVQYPGIVIYTSGRGYSVHGISFVGGIVPDGKQHFLSRMPAVTFNRFGVTEFVDWSSTRP